MDMLSGESVVFVLNKLKLISNDVFGNRLDRVKNVAAD